jgi:colicin import membrane protein
MSMRTISRSAVGGYIKLLRLPWDAAFAARASTGENHSGGTIVLDRFEARLRSIAGRALHDDELVRDAERRRLAADERARAGRLRVDAQRRSEHAEERLTGRVKEAQQQRRQAARQAADRKKDAERRRQAESRRIDALEARRRRANESAAAAKEEAIEHRSKGARLQQLDEEAHTLARKQDALTAKNESQRLRQAASKAKATRKRRQA